MMMACLLELNASAELACLLSTQTLGMRMWPTICRHAMISWADPDLISKKEWDREYAQPIMAGAICCSGLTCCKLQRLNGNTCSWSQSS